MFIFNKKITKISIIFFFLGFLLSFNSCGIYKKTDVRTSPINDADKRARNMEEGRGIIFGKKKNSGVFDFASSNEMWRAAISVLDFVPLSSADYGGGILISDWYSDQDNSLESYKITVIFLSNEIRADGLNVRIHRKVCNKSNSCRVIEKNSVLNKEIKLAILKKAALLKTETRKKMKENDKSYKKNTPNL